MAKGLLISYAGNPETPSSLLPDNGLASLASSLISQNHEIKILDYGIPETMDQLIPRTISKELEKIYANFTSEDPSKISQIYNFLKLKGIQPLIQHHQNKQMHKYAQEISDLVREEKPDFVGFKLWMGDGLIGTKIISEKLKKDHPNVKLFGGGPHAHTFKHRIFNYLPLEAICYDEGEQTILDLANYSIGKMNLEKISNIYFKDGTNIKTNPLLKVTDLNSLPIPIYDKEIYLNIDKKLPVYIIDETRGCAYVCPFCVQSARVDNKYRAKSSDRIVDEIQKLYDEKGVKLFKFGGQMTTGQIFNGIATELINRGIDISYSGFGHVNAMKNADLGLLKASGLQSLFFGIESGDQRLLDEVFLKKTKVDNIRDTLINVKAAGIDTVASFIYPAPFESEESRRNTYNLINETKPTGVLMYFSGLFPDTVWTNNAAKFGFNIESEDLANEVMTYKTKSFFPPRFWKQLPYTINGKNFKEYAKQTEEFVKELSKDNLMFAIDEHFLIARHINQDPSVFVKNLKQAFYSANTDHIKKIREDLYGHRD